MSWKSRARRCEWRSKINHHFHFAVLPAGSPRHAVCARTHVPPDPRSYYEWASDTVEGELYLLNGHAQMPELGIPENEKRGVDGFTVRSRDRTILAGVGKLKGCT